MKKTFSLYTREQYNEICEQVNLGTKPSIIAKTLAEKFDRKYNSVYTQVMQIKTGKARTTFAPSKDAVKPAKIEVIKKEKVVKQPSQAAIDIADMKDCTLSFTPKKVELFSDRCIMYF